jgi:hypothetical protein
MASHLCHNDAMNLNPYVEDVRRHLLLAAEAGGDEARAVAERLVAPLEAALLLNLQHALSAAAEEITMELAPGSVELRLRAGEPDFVVAPPAPEGPVERLEPAAEPSPAADPDEPATARINLRLPEHLKGGIEQAAARERLSVNAWLVRVAAAALTAPGDSGGPQPRRGRVGQSYTGWVR